MPPRIGPKRNQMQDGEQVDGDVGNVRPVMTVDLPTRPFLYTLDQIATLLGLSMDRLKGVYCYFQGRSTGFKKVDYLEVIDIAPRGEKPDWRVSEGELVRWLRVHGVRPYGRRTVLAEGR